MKKEVTCPTCGKISRVNESDYTGKYEQCEDCDTEESQVRQKRPTVKKMRETK